MKKYYLLNVEGDNSSKIEVESREKIQKFINDNKENTLVLPASILNNFEKAGKIIRKSISKENAITIEPHADQTVRKRKMLNPLSVLSPVVMGTIYAPALMFKMLGAITGTTELARINKRLDLITSQLEKVLVNNQAETLGKLTAALTICNDIEKEYQVLNNFTEDMIVRLSMAHNELLSLSYQSEVLVSNYTAFLENQKNDKKKIKAINEVLQNQAADYSFNLSVSLLTLKGKLMVNRLWLIHDLIKKPGYVETRLSLIENDLNTLEEHLSQSNAVAELSAYLKDRYQDLSWLGKKIQGNKVKKDIMQKDLASNPEEIKIQNRKLIIYKEKDQVRFITIDDSKEKQDD